MRQQCEQMTNVEREEERNHQNQIDRERHVKCRATMIVEKIEEEMRQHADNHFGRHPRFRYYMMNMIMRHRAQNSSAVFAKRACKICQSQSMSYENI